jgi:hypothetical protein
VRLLEAVAGGQVPRKDLDDGEVKKLREHASGAVRAKAAQVFGDVR